MQTLSTLNLHACIRYMSQRKVTMDCVIIMVTLLLLAVLSTNITMCRSGSKYIPLFCHLMSKIKSVLYM